MMGLKSLVDRAREDGWAAIEGRIDTVPYHLSLLGWSAVPSRTGGSTIDVLKPKTPDQAPKQSLSAKFGLEAQPLHTDGAHHPVPPDVVLLSASSPSQVPTLLWRMPETGIDPALRQDLLHGLFTVRSGNDAFLAAALEPSRVRYDPGCMTPGDSRASRVADFFAAQSGAAVQHEWTATGLILAIDNRRVLHARGAAHEEPARAMHRVAIRIPEEKA